jgi:methylated-DNA-[protein]-cysteine S-methyltransferase
VIFSIETVTSPIGVLTCVVKGEVLVALEFEGNAERLRRSLARRFGDVALPALSDSRWGRERPQTPGSCGAPGATGVGRKVAAYFEGDFAALESLAADPGGTLFERRVYEELRRIPRGEVTTYAALARRIGKPDAVRAVGAANAKNPVSIVVPCHRVIGANGSLTGYAGGIERKRWLLTHERQSSASSA